MQKRYNNDDEIPQSSRFTISSNHTFMGFGFAFRKGEESLNKRGFWICFKGNGHTLQIRFTFLKESLLSGRRHKLLEWTGRTNALLIKSTFLSFAGLEARRNSEWLVLSSQFEVHSFLSSFRILHWNCENLASFWWLGRYWIPICVWKATDCRPH